MNDAFGSASVRLLRKPAAVWTAWAGVSSREIVVYADANEEIAGIADNANLNFAVVGRGCSRRLPAVRASSQRRTPSR
jgi:hypothetical protein